jgi:hypothetical protein
VSVIDAFGCLCSLRAHVALDGVSWVWSGLVENAVGRKIDRVLQNRRHHPRPPSGVAPARELVSASFLVTSNQLCCSELGAVPKHGMHDDGKSSGECDPGLSHGGSFGDLECPVL